MNLAGWWLLGLESLNSCVSFSGLQPMSMIETILYLIIIIIIIITIHTIGIISKKSAIDIF